MATSSLSAPGRSASERRRTIWLLAWPAILENISVTAIWTVDTAMVGRLGAQALSAVGLGGQFLFTLSWIFGAIGVGATSLVARAIGAGDRERANQLAAQAAVLAAGVGTTVALVAWPLAPRLLSWVTQDPSVHSQGMVYLRTLLASLPLMLITTVVSSTLRGAGNTRVPLLVSLVANGSNILLDYMLIFGHWGAPRWGVFGAAFASAIAQALGFITLIGIIFSGAAEIQLSLNRLRHWRGAMARQIITLSLPAAAEEGLGNLARMLFVVIISALGTAAYAANTVAVSIESLSFMPGWGFAVASSALVGRYLGARQRHEALHVGWDALRLALLVMGCIGLAFLLFPMAIARIFTSDPSVLPLAAACIQVAALEQPAIALEMVFSGSLRGAGDTRTPLWVSLLGNWAVRIPLAWMAVHRWHAGIAAIWLVTAMDWTTRGAFLAWRYHHGAWAHEGLEGRTTQSSREPEGA